MPNKRKGLCNFFGETGKRIFCCYGIIRLNKYKLFSHQNIQQEVDFYGNDESDTGSGKRRAYEIS